MKKVLLITATTLLVGCNNFITSTQTQKNEVITPTTEYFIGEWECAMNGVAATSNKVKLNKNGKASYLGNVTLPAEKPLFSYALERSGSWKFADNTLTYSFNQSKVSRAHADEVQANIQADQELQNLEKEYFKALNQQTKKSGKSTVNLAVSNFTSKAFSIEQKVSDSVRSGNCIRVR
ncbi:hypothetical protein MHD_07765 [Mannheimia granulomatis]|uniref:Lipoprotein n=1 Tax=Mannheimia granulomatis TaxID=85402 RepID=A0A011P816_9PAST|nr:hypothetical protein [Mannheimia granulomatis]EXI62524.1 hypothetical protein AK33_04625 [Mannheimia granulomatis]RGE47847.1 hypothetical protein MHD_07765 [Mannheimia granulomatis]